MAEKNRIRSIKVISNTHWDREFRQSFERSRNGLLVMMDTLLEIMGNNSDYLSFTLDGHSILIDDYLEMRPEKRKVIEKLVRANRIIAGPWYTLAEQFSISHEALVRNLMAGKTTVEKYGGRLGTVAYTPASWGQTGQLPQILKDFGLDKIMFYRGISHHESDAEFIWKAPDGTAVLGCRFGLYARYNWFYQVHRAVTRKGRVFKKDHLWGEFDEIPVRLSDSISGNDPSFELKDPFTDYDPAYLKDAIEKMIAAEGGHFTTPVFPAMQGHDSSVPCPNEPAVIKDANEISMGKYHIEHSDLEEYWKEVIKYLDKDKLTILEGERRSYLKTGMWTYLFPATISARTYLKQKDFDVCNRLVSYAEPLSAMAYSLGNEYPFNYIERGWRYLLANHTHDANGGCAPDAVCQDMEYRYRKTMDIADIVTEDAMTYVAANISPQNQDRKIIRYIVFNTLPFARNAIVKADMEIPAIFRARSAGLHHNSQASVERQPLYNQKSSVFVDNIWDVPTILDSERVIFYAHLRNLPALGYRCYEVVPVNHEIRQVETMLTGPNTMENEFIAVTVNYNGTVDITNRETGRIFRNLNYITDQGEAGNAWQHEDLKYDKKICSLGVSSLNSVVTSGPLVCTIKSEFTLSLPVDYECGETRNEITAEVPFIIEYTLEKGCRYLKVTLSLNNKVKDHWLRINFPSAINTGKSVADSHFDVVEREIGLPESTGWVEKPGGTHPLRTFVDVSDGTEGLACFTKGIFEYEVFDDRDRTLAITLIRSCRIKLKVSEEKITELPDTGVQCPGKHSFEYAVCPHRGDYINANLAGMAAEYHTPVRALMSGRGKGNLPSEAFLFNIDNPALHITAVKMAEDLSGIVVRMYNTTLTRQNMVLKFSFPVKAISVRMDETEIRLISDNSDIVKYTLKKKEILSLKVLKY